jgi:hypothetical protein
LPGIGAAEIYHYGGVPKLLGCYEAELHGILTAAAIKGYDTVMNIGCAGGYYVAGLARLFPRTHVFAFDIDDARLLCAETAGANGVLSRVTLLGECVPADFGRLASGRTLVLCDARAPNCRYCGPTLPAPWHAATWSSNCIRTWTPPSLPRFPPASLPPT